MNTCTFKYVVDSSHNISFLYQPDIFSTQVVNVITLHLLYMAVWRGPDHFSYGVAIGSNSASGVLVPRL